MSCGSRYSAIAVSVARVARGPGDAEAMAHRDAVQLGELLLDDGGATDDALQVGVRALQPVKAVGVAQRQRVDAVELIGDGVDLAPVDLDLVEVLRRGGHDRRHPIDEGPGSARERRHGVAGDHQVGLGAVCDRPVDRVLEARREDGDEDHEREADHERRRRDRGPRRIARGVLARKLSGRVPEALQRPADDRRQRAHDIASAQRDADEHEQRAEPHRGHPAAGRAVPEQALDQECEPCEAHQPGDDPPPAAGGRRLGQRLVAHGRHRRHPGGAHGWDQGGDEGDTDAHGQADDDRPPCELHAPARDTPPGCVEERAEPAARSPGRRAGPGRTR